MIIYAPRIGCMATTMVSGLFLLMVAALDPSSVHAQVHVKTGSPATTGSISKQSQQVVQARPSRRATQPPAAGRRPPQLPPRTPFTAADEDAAVIPGMPDVRFWADSEADFLKALPAQPGPWLALSSGGSDGAFGAGLLVGLTDSGNRPDYSVVTGVSTGALMAPFVFAGKAYDDQLRDAYTKVTASDIFEVGGTGESFLDTWPLKELIDKQITPALMDDIAAQYRAGRRLFVITTELDADRFAVWNMGAIAVHGGDSAIKLFRNVLLASSSIPGAFPPVLIDVEANGKRFQEMHVDGGVGGQFFVAPAALMASRSSFRIPATQLYIVVNTGLGRDFSVVERSTPIILARTVGTAVKVDTRLMIDRAYEAAKRSGVGFNVATVDPNFDAPSHGIFDPQYMTALFKAGYEQGKGAHPFANEPPSYSSQPMLRAPEPEKTGANR
jgi:predicted acylesterase/phospholipase RssA